MSVNWRPTRQKQIVTLAKEIGKLNEHVNKLMDDMGGFRTGVFFKYWEDQQLQGFKHIDTTAPASLAKPRNLDILERLLRLEDAVIPKCDHCGKRDCNDPTTPRGKKK